MLTTLEVFIAASITAIATGLGVVPFLFRKLSDDLIGTGNAIAAGLMIAASIQLVHEGIVYDVVATTAGALVGYIAMIGIGRFLRDHPDHIGAIASDQSMRSILIVLVMTLHSFSEGIGVGVAYGGGEGLGFFVTAVIAIQNIPEGLAIALVVIPRGVSIGMAAVWAIVSSLPQPLMAVPSYLFVSFFEDILPAGLGFAAGAMTWMVKSEMIPETLKTISAGRSVLLILLSLSAAAALQYLL